MSQEFHLSDAELLMAADGELPARDAGRAHTHLAACWACRVRKQEMEGAIGEFIRFQRGSLDNRIPAADGPRALLKAQMERLRESENQSRPRWLHWATAAVLLLASGAALVFHTLSLRSAPGMADVTIPNPNFTPGATVLMGQQQVCQEAGVNNKAVPVALQRKVFAEYGIGPAAAGAYEVDYLVTPALGGADDIHNLWPQSSNATVWNARVKDDLEDHLRDLVCEGQVDLTTAQREIAGNWIEAYKKYFHTDHPLASRQ